LLRDGALKVIDITAAQGLVSMPSFHTTLAVLFMYSLRQYRILFRAGIALNAVMILSTPTQGGHYLADVFAGLLLAAATIVAYRALFDRRRLRLSLRVALLKPARNTA
jgi:membrane-associated phospholipid phosphatase